jgi:hypothetical protein
MYKIVLIFALGLISQFNVDNAKNNVEPEALELQEWAYWDAFSNTFNETADYWKAESAGLEAEKIAEERTNIDEFLKDIDKKEKSDSICKI